MSEQLISKQTGDSEPYFVSVAINAPSARVWHTITEIQQIVRWMGGDDFQLLIEADWKVNAPVRITGFHHIHFENKGTVLHVVPERSLRYTQLSSLSRLPDVSESYTTLDFSLHPQEGQTLLTLTVTNFPTETIRKHMELYWRTTIRTIKQVAESQI